MLAGLAIQKAAYDRLRGDAALTALLGGARVFDYVAANTPAPYLVLGDDGDIEIMSALFTDLGREAHEQTLTIHAWTETQRGRLTMKTLLARVAEVLLIPPLWLDGWTLLSTLFESAQVVQEEDGLTYHGIFRCRLHTEPPQPL